MGAPDLLRHLRGAGFTLTLADGGGIRITPAGALTDEHRHAIRTHKPELIALLTKPAPIIAAPVMPLPSGATGAAVSDAWCWPQSGDERVRCTDCAHYRPGRCGNYRAARLHSPEVGRDLAALLQRCLGFRA